MSTAMLLYLQRLATNEVRPSADLAWDAFLAGEFLTHATGEELSSLGRELASFFLYRHKHLEAYLGFHEEGYAEVDGVAAHHVVNIENCLSSGLS